eukprot:6189790-Pleurochrysis_carterae.AAC.1
MASSIPASRQAARPAASFVNVSSPTMRSRSPCATPRDCSHLRITLHVSRPSSPSICQHKHRQSIRQNHIV